MKSLSLLALVSLLLVAAPHSVDGAKRLLKTGRLAPASTTASPSPPPTFPPPKFNGYIVLSQYQCDDFLCPDWSLTVSRLATECYTWDCQNEQLIMETVVPKSPIRRMSFPVYTAYVKSSRNFYTVGNTNIPEGSASFWVTRVADNVSATTLKSSGGFLFPNATSVLVSIEAGVLNGTETMIAVFQDGTIATVDPTSGNLNIVGDALKNTSRILNQATTLHGTRLYLYTDALRSGEPGFVTFDLATNSVIYDVRVAPLQYNTIPPAAFQVSYIPIIKQLVFFSTGLFDQLIYADPATGASAYAIENLFEDDGMTFYDNPDVKSDDTYKNNAFDAETNMLYFQATQRGQGDGPITSLISVGPFVAGPPQPFYYVWLNLEPVNFGYQGFQYVHCRDGPCPT